MTAGLAALVLRARWPILAAVVVLTVLAVAAYSRLGVENNIDAWFSASDPEYRRYREFRERFETEETVFIVVHAPDVFARPVLERIDRITRALVARPEITRVTSLTNIEDITGTPDGIEVAALVPRLDIDGDALAALRARVLADPFFPGTIVSRDGRTTIIVAEVGRSTAATDAAVVDAATAALAANAGAGVVYHLAGWLPVNVTMNRLTNDDVQRGFPATVALLALCLAFFLRSLRAVLIVNLVVVLSILWTMGTFAALGFTGTAITVSALPGILLALGTATGVHVVARFYEARVKEPDPVGAIRIALPQVTGPVLLTSATTAVGLGSLVVAYMAPARHLGAFAALGMGYVCLVALTIVPIALATFPPRRQAHPNPCLERALVAVADFEARHWGAVLVASGALVLVGAAGLAGLRPQGTNLNYLPEDSAPRQAMRFIEDHFGGASTLDVVVRGGPDVVKEPATARVVAAVQELLASYPEVSTSVAYTDLLRRMHRALHDGDPAFYRLPETSRGIAQELLLYETAGGGDLPTLVDVNGYDIARVRGMSSSFMGMERNKRFFDDLGARLATLTPSAGVPLALEISGDWPLWLRMNLSLLDTMLESFGLAFAGVALMMILLVRSVPIGLLAMLPNVLPVLLAIGALGWARVELDFATVMVAGIALGIAVDDTIHYLARFRRELAAAGDPTIAMRRTHASVGKAMVSTSVVLFVGLGSMVTSSFPPHRTFGVIIAFTMLVALIADLLLLPALLHLADRCGIRLGPSRPA
jgi:hypothetical protein